MNSLPLRRIPFARFFGCAWLAIVPLLLTAQPTDQSLLWEVRKPRAKRVSYLFGTIHLIPKDSFLVTRGLQRAMQSADALVLELEVEKSAFSQMAGLLTQQESLLMPKNQRLTDFFSREEATHILEKSGFSALPDGLPERIYPIIPALTLENAGCDIRGFVSYELYLQERFRKTGRPVSGLETVSDQMKALTQMPLEDQVAYLRKALRSEASGCEQLLELASMYRQERIAELFTNIFAEEMPPGFKKFLLDDRNARWTPELDKLFKKQSVLVAVGAGHLVGPEGLVALLRAKGYQLTPILHSPTP